MNSPQSSIINHVKFGGTGELIHFAHANGYPPACYRAFLEPLTTHYRVVGMEQRPLRPDSNPADMTDWRVAADDLIAFLEQQNMEGVIGIGHSLGAVATMFAALKRPSLFTHLILIEPVFLPIQFLQLAIDNPELARLTPLVQGAMRRRNRWPTRQAAFDHFRPKTVFGRWSDEVMWDYVNNALVAANDGEGFTLRFSREWEAQFYATPPLTVWQDIPRLQHPTLGIRAAETDTIFPDAWEMWQELQPKATFRQIEKAGHLLPMERPLLLADTILEYLA